MTAALNTQIAAMPTGAAAGSAAAPTGAAPAQTPFNMRFRKLDPNELIYVLQLKMALEQQAALGQQQLGTQGTQQTGQQQAPVGGTQQAIPQGSQDAALAAQQAQQLTAQQASQQQAAQQQAAVEQAAAEKAAADKAAAEKAAAEKAAADAAAAQQAATPYSNPFVSSSAINFGAAVGGTDASPVTASASVSTSATAAAAPTAASTIAPRTKDDYWTAHIAQFRGKYLPDGPSMRPNCGPASVTIALRLVGLDIPGYNGQKSEAVLDTARIIGTGKNDTSVGTTDSELERMIEASGGRWSESNNLGEMLGWVQQGIPVILSGNPINAWNRRYSSDQVYPYDGGHWVTVSGYDPSTGYYIVNDPLSQIGPIYVSAGELETYNRSHGGLGIAVFR